MTPAPSSSSANRSGTPRAGALPARRSTRSVLALAAIAAAVLGPRAASAQYPNPGNPALEGATTPGTSAGRPRFSVDATLQAAESGTEVRIDYRLDRDELLFERTGDGYRAAYEVRVIFYKAKGGTQVTGDAFERSLRVASYPETRLRGADIIDNVTLRAPQGKYRLQVVITDLVAERSSGTEIPFEVPSAATQLVWFSDLSLGTAPDSAATTGGPRAGFTPVPSRQFGLDLPSLAVLTEIVDNRAGAAEGGSYGIRMRVVDETQETAWKGDTTVVRSGVRTPFLARPRLRVLPAGTYRIVLELTSPEVVPPGKKKPLPIRREREFTVIQTTENLSWESKGVLDILRFTIATGDEQEQMSRLSTPEERKKFWEEFWRKRDPTPETGRNEAQEEFYRRVQYANQHFGVGGPGWRTDMGQVYIVKGAPDEVVRNPFNFDRPPEEIWYYYKERLRYVFVDKDGFGRYEQVEPRKN